MIKTININEFSFFSTVCRFAKSDAVSYQNGLLMFYGKEKTVQIELETQTFEEIKPLPIPDYAVKIDNSLTTTDCLHLAIFKGITTQIKSGQTITLKDPLILPSSLVLVRDYRDYNFLTTETRLQDIGVSFEVSVCAIAYSKNPNFQFSNLVIQRAKKYLQRFSGHLSYNHVLAHRKGSKYSIIKSN